MGTFGKLFLAPFALATLLAFACPAAVSAADPEQPSVPDQSQAAPESVTTQPKSQVPGAPAASTKPAKPVKHHTVHHNKHHAKKKTHKAAAAAHKKPVKKTPAHKKTSNVKPAHAAAKAVHTAPVHEKHVAEAKPAPVDKGVTKQKLPPVNNGPMTKTVSYDLCLGYDNCVPHRYVATWHGNNAEAKVMQKAPDGTWTAGKIDPVMAAELGRMAQSEPGSNTERALTEEEKARIADRQGKTHAELMGEVKAQNITRVKDILRDMGIHSLYDLDAYDPRLRQNGVAINAVNELAAERASGKTAP
jgi:hypothetical protein